MHLDTSIVFRTTNDRAFVYLNRRPIDLPSSLSKVLNGRLRRHFNAGSKKYPILWVHIKTEPNRYDGRVKKKHKNTKIQIQKYKNTKTQKYKHTKLQNTKMQNFKEQK